MPLYTLFCIVSILSMVQEAPPAAQPSGLERCRKDRNQCDGALADAEKRRKGAISTNQTAIVDRIAKEIKEIKEIKEPQATDGPEPKIQEKTLQEVEEWDGYVKAYRKAIQCATAPKDAAECVISRSPAPWSKAQLHGGGDSGVVSEGVAEALTLVTDIAVKRAKQQGLAALQARVRATTCALKFEPAGGESSAVLPATCSLLTNTTIDKLVGDPGPLQIAIFQDLLATIGARFIDRDLGRVGKLAVAELGEPAWAQLEQLANKAFAKEPEKLKNLKVVKPEEQVNEKYKELVKMRLEAPDKAELNELAKTKLDVGAVAKLDKLVEKYLDEDAKGRLIRSKVAVAMFDALRDARVEVEVKLNGVSVTGSMYNLVRLSRIAVATSLRLLARKQVTFSTHDVQALLDLIRSSIGMDPGRRVFWGSARAVPLGLAAADLFLSSAGEGKSLVDIADKLAGEITALTAGEMAAALEIADLVITAVSTKQGGQDDAPERVRAVVALTFRILIEYFERHGESTSRLKDLRVLFAAALEQDVATGVSAAARLLISELSLPVLNTEPGGSDFRAAVKKRRAIENTVALLTGVAAYAETYIPKPVSGQPSEPAPAPDPAQLRQARREALENLIDATTVRTKRHGEWVASLGIPVGFTGGRQWIREHITDSAGAPVVNPDGTHSYAFKGNQGWMAPQFSLSLGIAVQRLVGRAYRDGRVYVRDKAYRGDERPRSGVFADGFHLFVSVIDLGQFLSYDDSGKINRPRWDSFISPGVQLGWIVGSPANSFIIALDARYAPTLFAGTSKLTVPTDTSPGGAFRVGLTLAYYIPLFDFN